jgi:hypothetical protein
MDRRSFLKTSLFAGLGALLIPKNILADEKKLAEFIDFLPMKYLKTPNSMYVAYRKWDGDGFHHIHRFSPYLIPVDYDYTLTNNMKHFKWDLKTKQQGIELEGKFYPFIDSPLKKHMITKYQLSEYELFSENDYSFLEKYRSRNGGIFDMYIMSRYLKEFNPIMLNQKPTKTKPKRWFTDDGYMIYNNEMLNPHNKKHILEIQDWHHHIRIQHNSNNEIHCYGCLIENEIPLNFFIEVDGEVNHYKVFHHKSKRNELITTQKFLEIYPTKKSYHKQ